MNSDWSVETERLMRGAGWYPGRREPRRVAEWMRILTETGTFKMSPSAKTILEEFGGIQVKCEGPGIDCARGSFNLDPALAIGEEDRFVGFGTWLGPALFPLGEVDDGRAYLAVDAESCIYLVGDEITKFAKSVRIALDAILSGAAPAWDKFRDDEIR